AAGLAAETTGESKSEEIAAAKSGAGTDRDVRLMGTGCGFAVTGGVSEGTTEATVTACSATGTMAGGGGGGVTLGGTGTAGTTVRGAADGSAGTDAVGMRRSAGKRMPQKPVAGSVNCSSTYPVTLR